MAENAKKIEEQQKKMVSVIGFSKCDFVSVYHYSVLAILCYCAPLLMLSFGNVLLYLYAPCTFATVILSYALLYLN